MSPSAAEMEAMKDKLVKMEFDHIAITTSHEKEYGIFFLVLLHVMKRLISSSEANKWCNLSNEAHSMFIVANVFVE